MKKPNFQNILVPIDFSDLSIQPIETAKGLTRRFGARIHLVHVQETMFPATFMAPMPLPIENSLALQHENENRLKKLRDLAAKHNLSPADCHVLQEQPAFDSICRLARELSIDLIVMPTHGRTGLKHVLLGSIAERVVQHSPCPVLIAREAGDKIKKILVPVDFSRCSLDALNYAIAAAKKATAKIILFHAVSLGYAFTSDGYAMFDLSEVEKALRKQAEDNMRAFVRAVKFGDVKFETAVEFGFAAEEICAFAQRKGVDLIITPTHGRTGFEHVLIGSVAERIVRHADRPVLVVPSHPEIRVAPLKQRPQVSRIGYRVRRTGPRNRKPGLAPRQFRKAPVVPFSERRKTNKFRESHGRTRGER